MFLSRATLRQNADIGSFIRMACRDRYREHQILWNFFSGDPDAERDFLFRYELRHGTLQYYILSQRIPRDETGTWEIATKEFNPCLQEGQKLAFVLRANPVITVKDKKGKAKRHDVVMHEKHCIDYKNIPIKERPPLQKIVTQSGFKWLSSRSEKCGFKIAENDVIIDSYKKNIAEKKYKSKVEFCTIDFRGILIISAVDRFQNILFSGIGKAKAFGCGLLLVKRI